MSKLFDKEDPRPVSNWVGGHARPSTPLLGWSEPRSGVYLKQGWSVITDLVSNTTHPGRSHELYRVFPPSTTKHVGSFTELRRAKAWVERQLPVGRGALDKLGKS